MDNKILVENAYRDYHFFLDNGIFTLYRDNINKKGNKSHFHKYVFDKGVELLDAYLVLIIDPILKVICLNRLKQDVYNLVADIEGDLISLSKNFDISDIIQNDESEEIASTKNVRGVCLNLSYYIEDTRQALEFELIGATPKQRTTKQKSKGPFTRSSIALVFSLLEKRNFLDFEHGERIKFAKDIESIVRCDSIYLRKYIQPEKMSEIKDLSAKSIDHVSTLLADCLKDIQLLKTEYARK